MIKVPIYGKARQYARRLVGLMVLAFVSVGLLALSGHVFGFYQPSFKDIKFRGSVHRHLTEQAMSQEQNQANFMIASSADDPNAATTINRVLKDSADDTFFRFEPEQ